MLRRIADLPHDQLDALAALARGEGYRLLDRMVDEWRSGTSRFDAPGELLLGVYDEGAVIAIGGIHRDPYAGNDRVGRLRRVYVTPAWRRRGSATTLVRALLDAGRADFDLVRLRVPDARAARYYEALGFDRTDETDATHIMRLR
jgi:GNAT superfamily N-acetyltransferase